MKILDLTGLQFGKLFVVEKIGSQDRHSLYKCECGCGNVINVKSISLVHQNKKSCGCDKPKTCGEITPRIWGVIKSRANKNGWSRGTPKTKEFDITIDYIWDLFISQDRKCAISGVDICFGEDKTASLDRIDSSKGYIKGNVQWLHKTVNNMKQNLSDFEFISFCVMVAEFADV